MLNHPKPGAGNPDKAVLKDFARGHSFVAAFAIVLSLALLRSTPASAQVVKAGFSAATFSPSPTAGRRTGFVGGISFLTGTSDRGGWQVEALVQQKGVHNVLRPGDSIRQTYVGANYLAHFDVAQFGRADRGGAYFLAGPALSFNVQASYTDQGVTLDIKDRVRNVDAGVVAGGGVESGRLILEARYDWGLRDAFREVGANNAFKNRSFAVMVGARLRN